MVNREQGQTTYPNTPETSGPTVERRKFLLGAALGISLTGMAAACGSNENRGSSTTTPEYPAETTSETATPTAEAEPLVSPEENLRLYDLTQNLDKDTQTAYKELLDKSPDPFITAYDSPKAGAEHYLEETLLTRYLDDEQGRQELAESIQGRYSTMTYSDIESMLTNAKIEPKGADETYGLYQIIDRDATVCAVARRIVETYRESDYAVEASDIATKLLYAHFLSHDDRTQNSGSGDFRDSLATGIQSTVSRWSINSVDSTDFEQKFARPSIARGKGEIEPIGVIPIAFNGKLYPGENEVWPDKYPSLFFPRSIRTTKSELQDEPDRECVDNGENDTPSQATVDSNALHIPVVRRVATPEGSKALITRFIPGNPNDADITQNLLNDGVVHYPHRR